MNKHPRPFYIIGRRFFDFVLIVIGACFIGGCASVVYKDAASTYVTTTKELTKQLNDVTTRLGKAEDNLKLGKIVTDKSCPIAQSRLFIRDGSAVVFSSFLQRYPDLLNSKDCKPLIACESPAITGKGRPSECLQACYTVFEGNCLTQIEKNYAIDAKQIATQKIDANSLDAKRIASDVDKLAAYLQRVEYGRTASIGNRLVADNLQILAQYLDILEKATIATKPDLTDEAQRLSDKIKKVTDGYTNLTNEQLSSSDQKSRDAIQKNISVLGKFLNDIKVLVKNAKDAEKIKAFVKSNAVNVTAVVDAIEPVISGDDLLEKVFSTEATKRVRNQIQTRFNNEPDAYNRLLIFNDIAKYPYATVDSSSSALKEVFDNLSKSHNTLVSLVNNPTDEQIKARRNEEFQQLRTLVEDTVGVIALIK